MNPGTSANAAHITYMFANGSAPQTPDLPLAANSRGTVNVNEAVGPDRNVSVKVTPDAGKPIVVERPMCFEYYKGWDGGHNVMGYCP